MSIRVYWLDSRTVDPDSPAVQALMSDARRQKLADLRHPEARRNSAAAELLLALCMAREENRLPAPVRWHAQPGGKPALAHGPHFSLSHAGDAVVCAVSEREVGADIEPARQMPPAMRRKVLSPAEQERPDDQLLFTWVAKESFVKLTGEGLKRMMTGFSAIDGAIWNEDGERLAYLYAVPFPWSEYTLCVCSEQAQAVELIGMQWNSGEEGHQ